MAKVSKKSSMSMSPMSTSKSGNCDNWRMLVIRVFIALTFAVSVWGKFTNFSGKSAFAQSSWISFGVIPGELFIVIAIIMELFGVITLLSGWKMKQGARVLALFVFLTIVMFHYSNFNAIVSHLFMIGGLMAVCMLPPGKFACKYK